MKNAIHPVASEVFYQCVESCNEGIMITSQEGKLTYVNPAWQKTYGFTEAEALGQTPRLLHSGVQDAQFYRKMWDDIRNADVGYWRGELVNRKKCGDHVHVLLLITPIKGMTDPNSAYMGISIDLSEQRNLEMRMMQQEKLASVGVLASSLAHEIGTPLGVIRGRAELMMIQNVNNAQLTKGLEVIVGQIDRISRLISSLLKLSRPPQNLEMSTLHLNGILNEIGTLLEQSFRKQNIQFNVQVPSNAKILGNMDHIQQIFLNLIMNAIHAIGVRISEGHFDDHQVAIVTKESELGHIVIEVTDTGCGIPPHNLQRITEPFFTTKSPEEGTGLGLAIVQRLVNDMKGFIQVRSEIGKGTTFLLGFQSPPPHV